MSISDPLRTVRYSHGELVQQCDACHWAQRGHWAELAVCPRCVAPLSSPLAIRFGGFTIVSTHDQFLMHDNTGNQVLLQGADVADAIRFLALHATDYRMGEPAGERPPQSVPYRDLVATKPQFW